MISMFDDKLCKAVVIIGLSVSVSACYYMQAARGQLEVMNKRESIDELIHATDTPAELAKRLTLVNDARRFSIDELSLPDNDSYRSYADLQRDYVVWNVFATPEFSLEPKHWCFPIAGCVNYRGYFSENAARKEAAKLREQGFDVGVGGVTAYSTLGKFSDPILNTMMRWDDVDLVAVMFHELAHQVLYVKNDSGFNESFATAVEEAAIKRWLMSRGQGEEIIAYRQRGDLRQQLMRHVELARADLEEIYASSVNVDQMRLLKAERLDQLTVDINVELEQSDSEAPAWVSGGLNNARLASMNLYRGRLPEFRTLLADCNDELRCFYAAARKLSEETSTN